MPLPDTATPAFRELIDVYKHTDIEFPALKKITAAQWAVESGWGSSNLAHIALNYAGMKYRKALDPYAKSLAYEAHDGVTNYAQFPDHAHFIAGFWARFDQASAAYGDWRKFARIGPAAFIQQIGPPWVGGTRKDGEAYIKQITMIAEKRFNDVF